MMGWSIGYDSKWKRDIGYGVLATCDYPECGSPIHRGLSYVCGGEPYGGEHGCGLYFREPHLHLAGKRRGYAQVCGPCRRGMPPHKATPDVRKWIEHKLMDESWAEWRAENPAEVAEMTMRLAASKTPLVSTRSAQLK